MVNNYSISYVMPNLLIGLCKGSRLLGDYSKEFHEKLGYEFFRLDFSFHLSTVQRISNPDAIVFSRKIENTILFEWTQDLDSSRKQDQLLRYSQITQSDLANLAAVPQKATQNHDVAIIVSQEAVKSFSTDSRISSNDFPVLTLEFSNKYLLKKKENNFKEKGTDSIFSKGIEITRIPRYLPFSIDKIDSKEIVTPLVNHIASLLVKEVKNFTLLEICKEIVPGWNYIGQEKQKTISLKVKELLKELSKPKLMQTVIKRASDDPPTWELYPENFKSNTRSYQKRLIVFIKKIKGGLYQMSFDF